MRSYHVAPRHTAGSPAQVDHATAMQVAREELCAGFENAVKAKCEDLDVQGIVYSTIERQNKIYLYDELTHERFVIPAKDWAGQHWYARTDRYSFIMR